MVSLALSDLSNCSRRFCFRAILERTIHRVDLAVVDPHRPTDSNTGESSTVFARGIEPTAQARSAVGKHLDDRAIEEDSQVDTSIVCRDVLDRLWRFRYACSQTGSLAIDDQFAVARVPDRCALCFVGRLPENEFERVGQLSGIQKNGEDVSEARAGERVSVAIDGPTVGRQIDEGDELWVDLPEKHAKILEQELKEEIPADEREALNAYLEKMRKRDPFWGK